MNRLAARLLILHPEHHQLLVVTRKHELSRLCFPGGKTEPHETLEEGLVRETLEETGLVVPVETLVPIHMGVVRNDVAHDPHLYEVHTFYAPWHPTYLYPSQQEARVIPQWVSPQDYLSHCMDRDHDQQVWEAFEAFVVKQKQDPQQTQIQTGTTLLNGGSPFGN